MRVRMLADAVGAEDLPGWVETVRQTTEVDADARQRPAEPDGDEDPEVGLGEEERELERDARHGMLRWMGWCRVREV